jgi:hypothetical protein
VTSSSKFVLPCKICEGGRLVGHGCNGVPGGFGCVGNSTFLASDWFYLFEEQGHANKSLLIVSVNNSKKYIWVTSSRCICKSMYSIDIQLIQHRKCCDIYLVITYRTCFGCHQAIYNNVDDTTAIYLFQYCLLMAIVDGRNVCILRINECQSVCCVLIR